MLRSNSTSARSTAAAFAASAALSLLASSSIPASAGGENAKFSPHRPAQMAQASPDWAQPPTGGDHGGQPAPNKNGVGGLPGDIGSPMRNPGAGPASKEDDSDPGSDAIEKLKSEARESKSKPAKQHPLAAALPGMDVTVCEAGCPSVNEQPHVTYVQPSNAATAKPGSKVEPTAASDPSKEMIQCVAGCYTTPRTYQSAAATAAAVASEGHWTATVTPASSGTGSGEWMRRIDGSREPAPADVKSETSK